MIDKQIASFGGGSFWCMEALIQRLEGVESVVSGYAGGHSLNPDYRAICGGTTGHVEVVQVVFNADVISYKDLIMIFMNSHDPTSLNFQDSDRGPQYRSIVLFHDELQKAIAMEVFEEFQRKEPAPIVTELAPMEKFYPAEDYHQDYYNNNSKAGYCRVVIKPKLDKLRKNYADKLKNELA